MRQQQKTQTTYDKTYAITIALVRSGYVRHPLHRFVLHFFGKGAHAQLLYHPATHENVQTTHC